MNQSETASVPLKPTPEMIAAGEGALDSYGDSYPPWMLIEAVYNAMVAASLPDNMTTERDLSLLRRVKQANRRWYFLAGAIIGITVGLLLANG